MRSLHFAGWLAASVVVFTATPKAAQPMCKPALAVTEASISFDGPGCVVGLAGRTVVSTPGGEVVLNPGQAVVVPEPSGGVIADTDTGVSFLRCVAPV